MPEIMDAHEKTGMEIAVIGMAGRFPGARTIDEFWKNLKNGVESISFFSDQELLENGIDPILLENRDYVKAKGALFDIENFDVDFFEYTGREAEIMDPQLRILHENCWEALENAGYNPWVYQGLIGLYAGASSNYLWLARFFSRIVEDGIGENELFEIGALNSSSSFCTRISYKLNLKGPSVFVQTACSTSLVAIHLACQGLLGGECDIALAGGISISIPRKSGYLFQQGMLYSLNGHVRAFDACADGTVFGSGVGVVVLKPLEDAITDRDTIYAVVKGSAINNDGGQKVGYTAPGTLGQAAVVRAALEAAQLEPESISYIETHGTGTTLGDPIEIEALTMAFNSNRSGFCKIGSVKNNIGHLDAAAGAVSFIKIVLALMHRQIPPTVHFRSPNTEINFTNSPFRVNTTLSEWKNDKYPLRGGVSSFGIGGTNAHVILEEGPYEFSMITPLMEQSQGDKFPFQLILLSARSQSALEQMTENFVHHFKNNPATILADAAYTLQMGRKAFEWRRICVSPTALAEENQSVKLFTASDPQWLTSVVSHINENRPVVFMFPGQGSQYINMGLELYKKEPEFRSEINRCFKILKPILGYDLKEIVFPEGSVGTEGSSSKGISKNGSYGNSVASLNETLHHDINQTEIAQPLLFIFEYALARLLMKWGIKPYAMMGHSIGEYTAACLAGVFSLADALTAVALRGKLMQRLPGGSMLSISLPEKELTSLLTPEISLAAVNSPTSCVVSGTHGAIDSLENVLSKKGIMYRHLHTSHAFHSSMMDPVLSEFAGSLSRVTFNNPQIPYISNLSGNWIKGVEAGDPGYWARHLRETVRFSKGVEKLLENGDCILVEVGPGKSLTAFINQHKRKKHQRVINLIRHPKEDVRDDYYFLSKIGQLWLNGAVIDWEVLHDKGKRCRIPLPTYPFEARRFETGGNFIRVRKTMADAVEQRTLSLKEHPEIDSGYLPPENEIQQILTDIWRNFFRLEQVGITDDFFELGGDSLKASIIISLIHKEFKVEVPISEFFQRPSIENIAIFLAENKDKSTYYSIKPLELKEYYPASSAQKRLFVLNVMDDRGVEYNLSSALVLEGHLDFTRLEDTFRGLINRHGSLRSSFQMVEGELFQKIHDEVDFNIEYYEPESTERNLKKAYKKNEPALESKKKESYGIDFAIEGSRTSSDSYYNKHSDRIIKTFVRPFDLSKAPLLRVGVIQGTEKRHLLMVDMHHIIADGTSMVVLIRECMALYKGEDLPKLKVQYTDFSEWQNSAGVRRSTKQQEMFWLKKFEEEIPSLNLPIDYPRPIVQNFSGSTLHFNLGKEESQTLKQYAQKVGVTLYILLLSIINILLSKVSGQEDIIIGTPIVGRKLTELRKLIGMFVNTLALRNYPLAEITSKHFLLNVKEQVLQAFENQDFQFEDLVENVVLNRDTGRNPVFDVMFAFQNLFEEPEEEISPQEIEGLTIKPYVFENDTSIFDLSIYASEQEGQLFFKFEYCTKLFQKETIHRFIKYFRIIATEVVANPGKKISDIEILSNEDRIRLLVEFNDTKKGYPVDKAIHELYKEQVEKIPDHIALLFEDKTLTYNYLNKLANQIANYLYFNLHLQLERCIGLIMDRAINIMPAIFGILKAGGSYVPIDASLPTHRIKHMINDANIEIVVSLKCLTDILKSLQRECRYLKTVFYLDSLETCENICERKDLPKVHSHNLAYVTYTSGTTGLPKGITIEHRSVVNFIKGITDVVDFKKTDRIFSLTTISFDIFGLEAILPLIKGSKVIMGNREEQTNPSASLNVIIKEDISIFQLTPSRLYMLLADNCSKQALGLLKYLIIGGEAFQENLLNEVRSIVSGKIYNVYGPTETTIWSTIKDVTGENKINIGHPIANTEIFILDKSNQLLPIRIAGELCIGGDGLAKGYLNNQELTRMKFIVNPICSGERIYKTGDLAAWLPDGNVEFLGRIDQQVKIRGFRIELEEIEHHLEKINYITKAVVIDKKDKTGGKYLCAYIATNKKPVVSEIRESLTRVLPDYMIPSYFVTLENIPLTPSGKLNRKALPEPEYKSNRQYSAPRNRMEVNLEEIWSQILGIKEKIGINANFFELGGHSLKATLMISQIHKKFSVKLPLTQVFKTPFIKDLAELIKKKRRDNFVPIKVSEKKEYYPLSSAQKRTYILNIINEDSIGYNVTSGLQIEGDLNNKKIEDTFLRLIMRHEILRTSFELLEDEPVQKISREAKFALEYYDLENFPEETGGKECLSNGNGLTPESIIKNFIRPFNLSQAPLLRVGLIKKEARKYFLLADFHHIITDGTSMALLIREALLLYGGEELPKPRIQYKDFVAWQDSLSVRTSIRQQEKYWLKEFELKPSILNLATDFPRPLLQSFCGNSISFQLEKKETQSLKEYAHQEGVTLFMLLLAFTNVLLSKLSGQEDIVIGAPIAGRRHGDLEQTIGMFVNTLALRNYPLEEKTCREFLHDVKEKVVKAFENQEYQFEDLVEKLKMERDMGRNPLFDVMLVLQNMIENPQEISNPQIQSLKIKPYDFENRKSLFDLSVLVSERGEQLHFEFEYCTRLYRKETILRFIYYFNKIATAMMENPEKKMSTIEILSEEEIRRILHDFNRERVDYPNTTTYRLFEEQVERSPDYIALISNMEKVEKNDTAPHISYLSYKKLNEKSNRLTCLLADKGVEPNTIVGIMAERSIEMIVSIYAVLKAGGAYLPIDPEYPLERINYMLTDSKVKILISDRKDVEIGYFLAPGLDHIQALHYKTWNHRRGTEPSPIPTYSKRSTASAKCRLPQSLVYIIYTSGSTGKPKGVMVEHRALVNRLIWMQREYPIGPGDVILQKTAFTFDVSVWEIFWWSFWGASLRLLMPGEEKNPVAIVKTVLGSHVTILHFVPSMMNAFLEYISEVGNQYIKVLASLKQVFSSGEALTVQQVEKFKTLLYQNNNTRLANLYGPTEATVDVSHFNCHFNEKLTNIPIGKPIANIQLYIMDKKMGLQPIGVAGELYISGDGVARGYLNRPSLTAEKFIIISDTRGSFEKPPLYPAKLILKNRLLGANNRKPIPVSYRTGDLTRRLPDGNIEFLGRLDNQVKIRGNRIELGEIETRILNYERIKEAVVLARENTSGEKYLCAYIVPVSAEDSFSRKITDIPLRELRDFLSGYLPDYMIPSFFVHLEKLPLTPNGKVDRNMLQSYEIDALPGVEYVAPGTEVEKIIADIWQAVLDLDKVGVRDNFFDIGGNSLSIIKVNARLNRAFDKDISMAVMFRYSTISSLAEYFSSNEIAELSSQTDKRIDEAVNIMDEAGILFADEIL